MISILCPTRGRPELAMRLLESILNTQHNENEILFGLQEDDPKLDEYTEDIKSRAIIFKPSSTVSYWNSLAIASTGNILTLMGDDIIMRSKDWDLKFEEIDKQYPDGVYLITQQDGRSVGVAPNHLPTPHPTISRAWMETLGYFVFPGFYHYYCDTWNAKIAQSLNRQINLYDVLWEHDKQSNDTRQFLRFNKWAERDKEIFYSCSRHRDSDLKLLQSRIEN